VVRSEKAPHSGPYFPGSRPRALRAFFVFFTHSVSNQYNQPFKFPSKNKIFIHFDTAKFEKPTVKWHDLFFFPPSPSHPVTPSVFPALSPRLPASTLFARFLFFLPPLHQTNTILFANSPAKPPLSFILTPTEFEKTPSKTRFASTCFRGRRPGRSAEVSG
jgi:hypothetical protein